MEKQVQEILTKVAGYIEVTQPLLDKHNELRDNFLKRAHQAAGVLANKGLIARDAVNAFVDKVASDESGKQVWDLVETLANAVRPDDLGKKADVASPSDVKDPWMKLVLFGDARADTRTPGMVD